MLSVSFIIIIIIIIYSFEFFTSVLAYYIIIIPSKLFTSMAFHKNLSNSKLPQVFRALLYFLDDQNNGVAWIVSAHPPFSNSSSSLTKRLGIVTITAITIGITVNFMFHILFRSLAKSKSAATPKFTIRQVLFIYLVF